jgi:hypothetical protein
MTNASKIKIIKNEQWSAIELYNNVKAGILTKPKFQRKKKWSMFPSNTGKDANVREFIEFLQEHKNNVEPLTFGNVIEESTKKYANINGNNRICAIISFMDAPFKVFPEFLETLFEYFDKDENFFEKEKVKKIFENVSYDLFMNTSRINKIFKENGNLELYDKNIELFAKLQDTDFFEDIKDKLVKNFDNSVKININICENYSFTELAELFYDLNKHDSTMSESEILASRLYEVTGFRIRDKVFISKINQKLIEYYEDMSKDEALTTHRFNPENEEINAFDFLVGTQKWLADEFSFIKDLSVSGKEKSLVLRLFESIYGSKPENFTSNIVNNFVETIPKHMKLINDSFNGIYFYSKIQKKGKPMEKLISPDKDAIKSISSKSLCYIVAAIMGFKINNVSEENIQKCIKRVVLFHYMLKNAKSKEIKDKYKEFDSLGYEPGGAYFNTHFKKILKNPEEILSKLSRSKFEELLKDLMNEVNTPHERYLPNKRHKNNKRRKPRVFEYILYSYYISDNVPLKELESRYSMEHISPFSSSYEGCDIDLDRFGNIFPLALQPNIDRSNKHIREIKSNLPYLKNMNVIPTDDEYDSYMKHENKKAFISDNEKYNKICDDREKIYIDTFLNKLY